MTTDDAANALGVSPHSLRYVMRLVPGAFIQERKNAPAIWDGGIISAASQIRNRRGFGVGRCIEIALVQGRTPSA